LKAFQVFGRAGAVAVVIALFLAPSPAVAHTPADPSPVPKSELGAVQVVAAPVRLGPYTWVNERSGKCLDQNYSGGVPHSNVLAWPCNGARNQLWYYDVYANGIVRFVNARSGQCLDQKYTGGVEYPDVLAWPCSAATNQNWREFIYTDGTFRFQNVRSGKYLDQDYSGGVEHSRVIAFTNKPTVLNQYWI
jgi:hypothetical protein